MKELSTAQLDRWCKTATEQIRFGPDRRRVAEELRNHLEDHRMSLIEQGMDQQEANLQALEAMGSAEELAPQLAAIHKPFWGRVIRTCKILLVLLLLCGTLPIFNYYHSLCYDAPDLEELYSAFYCTLYKEAVHLSTPKVSFSSDGSTFTVTDAMILTTKYDDTELQILVEQRNLLPWKEQLKYLPVTYEYFYPGRYYSGLYFINKLEALGSAVAMDITPITNRFYAIDSTGKRYDNIFGQKQDTEYGLSSGYVRGGLFSCTILCELFPFESAGVEWVDLCYDRDGRSYTLRIDLTGGATE